jgi:glutathione peroxidase
MYKLLIGLVALYITNIYSLQYTDIDGNQINMSNYQNKKILLVNIATGSEKVSQLAGLQQLYQLYGDSVVIIGFPSNSFAKEPRSNAEIKQFCQANYGVTFKLAAKNSVSGAGVQTIYNWINHVSENGLIDIPINRDFQKVLIGKDGSIQGVFSSSVNPMDSSIQNALLGN